MQSIAGPAVRPPAGDPLPPLVSKDRERPYTVRRVDMAD